MRGMHPAAGNQVRAYVRTASPAAILLAVRRRKTTRTSGVSSKISPILPTNRSARSESPPAAKKSASGSIRSRPSTSAANALSTSAGAGAPHSGTGRTAAGAGEPVRAGHRGRREEVGEPRVRIAAECRQQVLQPFQHPGGPVRGDGLETVTHLQVETVAGCGHQFQRIVVGVAAGEADHRQPLSGRRRSGAGTGVVLEHHRAVVQRSVAGQAPDRRRSEEGVGGQLGLFGLYPGEQPGGGVLGSQPHPDRNGVDQQPTNWSTPGSSGGRPETVAPKTTS